MPQAENVEVMKLYLRKFREKEKGMGWIFWYHQQNANVDHIYSYILWYHMNSYYQYHELWLYYACCLLHYAYPKYHISMYQKPPS